jgi:hypothetical protein
MWGRGVGGGGLALPAEDGESPDGAGVSGLALALLFRASLLPESSGLTPRPPAPVPAYGLGPSPVCAFGGPRRAVRGGLAGSAGVTNTAVSGTVRGGGPWGSSELGRRAAFRATDV